MIKALTTPGDDGSRVLVLGLSDDNWQRLRDGQPIPVRLQDLDPSLAPYTVLLVGGPDEESIYQDLRAHVRIREVHGRTRGDPPP